MSRAQMLLAAVAVLGLLASGYLLRENRRLADRVSELESRSSSPAAASSDGEAPELDSEAPETGARGLWSRLGRPAGVDRPELPEQPKETRQQRRARRQQQIRDFLGRAPGESEADYLARMRPLIEMGLKVPRERLADARAEAEKLAGVTDDQRARLDEVFEDTYREALELTNTAIASGELSPYERNWAGAAQVVGGLGAILEGAEGRIGGVLSADQLRRIRDSGFEWGEYLGVNAPWEELDAPPPPPDSDEDGS